MADTDSKILSAAADLLAASGKLVQAVSDTVPATGEPQRPDAPSNLVAAASDSLDSPAWYDAHAPGGSAEVGTLGTNYLRKHVPATTGPDNKLHWDPSKGATWMDFARIGRSLFAKEQIFDGTVFRSTPFSALRKLQEMLEFYDVEQPEKSSPVNFPWPTAQDFTPTFDPTWTVRRAISEFLSHYNLDADGNPANRDKDFKDATGTSIPGGPLLLNHAQCVELHHMLTTQEDVQLVAPYDRLANLAW